MKRLWLVLVLGAAPAAAVEKGGFGLEAEAGTRRTIGVVYHPSARLALRPGFFFQRLQAEQVPQIIDPFADAPVYETEDTVFGGRLEMDYFLEPQRRLAPFLSVIAAVSRGNTPYPASPGGNLVIRNGNITGWSLGGGFGLQYAVTGRLHVFAEGTLSYTSTERLTLNGRKLRARSWSTATSAVGVAFYLNGKD
jgi:hypothetical protein